MCIYCNSIHVVRSPSTTPVWIADVDTREDFRCNRFLSNPDYNKKPGDLVISLEPEGIVKDFSYIGNDAVRTYRYEYCGLPKARSRPAISRHIDMDYGYAWNVAYEHFSFRNMLDFMKFRSAQELCVMLAKDYGGKGSIGDLFFTMGFVSMFSETIYYPSLMATLDTFESLLTSRGVTNEKNK